MNVRMRGALGAVSILVLGLSALSGTSAAADDVTGGVLSGKVTFKSAPVSGATVYAEDRATSDRYAELTDGSGSYAFDYLPSGSYTVFVEGTTYDYSTGAANGRPFLLTYAGNTVRAPEAATFAVSDEASATANIAAIAGASLTGKVLNAKGKPAKGVTVYANNSTRSGWASATTDSKGRYVLYGLATGKVFVTSNQAAAFGSRTATATQGATRSVKTIKLQNDPVGTITATVKGLKSGDSIFLYDTKAKTSAHVMEVYSSKTVKLNEKVAPGTYRVVVGGTNKPSKAVTVKANKKSKAGTVKAPAKRTKVTGTIKGSNGKPLPHASVTVTDAYGAWAGFATASAKGKYSITGVVAGKYSVSAYDPTKASAPTSASFTVKKGKNAKKSVKLAKGLRITGTVKAGSTPLAGVTVWAQSLASNGAYDGVETGANGKFTLKGFPRGKVQVVASDSFIGGYHLSEKSVTLKSKNVKWNVSLKK